MSKVKPRKAILNTKWNNDIDEMICCCSYNKPLCNNYNSCELMEVIINPYDDIDSVCKNTRRKYKRKHNRLRQY